MSRGRGNRGGILKILLIIVGVIVLCAVIGGIYVATHWRGWAADVANAAAAGMVKESGLPADQRDAILAEIKQFGNDFKDGKVGAQEISRVAQTLAEGPLIPLAGVQAARHLYIEPSDMNDKEKAAAILTVQRFARGVFEKKIPKETLDDVVKPVVDSMPNGRWRMKEKPTRAEIDQFLANAKAKADAAMIPNEPFEMNIADELKKAIHGG